MKCSRPSRTRVSGSKAQTKMVAHLIEPKCSDKIQNNELIKKQKYLIGPECAGQNQNKKCLSQECEQTPYSATPSRSRLASCCRSIHIGERCETMSRFFIVSVDVLLGVPDKPPKLWRRSLTLTWCQSFRTKKTSSKPNISWKWVNSRIESWLWITLGT